MAYEKGYTAIDETKDGKCMSSQLGAWNKGGHYGGRTQASAKLKLSGLA